MSNNIVHQFEGELRVASDAIAEHTENEHRAVLQLISTYTPELEAFGQVAFEMRAGYNNAQVRVAQLTEQQATLLITYMRNSGPVREFKLRLVKEFYEMRQALTAPKSLEERSLELIGELSQKMQEQAAQLEAQQPLVDQALTYQGGSNLTTRQEFAREIISWATAQGIEVMQSDVFKFLAYRLKMFVAGNRSDTGGATTEAIRRGFAVTQKGTAQNGHNYATGKLTVEGKAYAWERVTRYINANGTLRLPVEAVA